MKEIIIVFRHYLYFFAMTLVFNPLRKGLLIIIHYLERRGVDEARIVRIIYLLSWYYSRSLQVICLPPVDISSLGSEDASAAVNNQCCFAKPQYFYENYPLEFSSARMKMPLRLESARVIGASNFVVTKERKIIYELHYLNGEGKFCYSDPAFFLYTGKKFVIRAKAAQEKIRSGIWLSGNFSGNYYHLLLEFMPKFLFLEKLSIPSDVPLLVDTAIRKIPQLQELLEYFNREKREIIYLDRGCLYDVETLYYLPIINFVPPDYADVKRVKYADCFFHTGALEFIRTTLLPRAAERSFGPKIYLSRKKSMSRRRCNEDEVIRVFEKYGFEICYPENLSVAEQIALFSRADFVAGVTGAAFTNLIFAKPGCKALCLQSFVLDLSIFSTVAKLVGVDFQYYSAHDRDYVTDDLHEKFTVDVVDLERVLIEFLKR